MNQKFCYVKEPPKSMVRRENGRLQPGLWMTHDPAIFRDPVSGMYYIYSTGGLCRRSQDLIHWENLGQVVSVPAEAQAWTGSNDIWAPDMVKAGGEYRLYCSNSSWGVQLSCIFLAVADCPEGPFEPCGIVLKTSDRLPVNGIDANIVTDEETGRMYMVYGSFWGGCHLLELDKGSGLAVKHEACAGERCAAVTGENVKDAIGICLARRPFWQDGAIEGPYLIRNKDTGFYYLFVSCGSLKSDYQIRVGRSRKIEGPYLDSRGRELTDVVSEEMPGNLLMAGYRWNDGKAWMAPGHNSVLCDDDGAWYLFCHVREKNFTGTPEPSTMQVRRIFWSADGWPVVSSAVYAREWEEPVPEEELSGFYERIDFQTTYPQGISTATPMILSTQPGTLRSYEHCSLVGSWERRDANTIRIICGPHTEEAHVCYIWDRERECTAIGLCGINEKGTSFWAKKVPLPVW